MVSSPRKCPSVEGKVCGHFLPSKEHDHHCLCIVCRGKSCTLDDRCEKCHEWTDECCKSVADYVEKLSLQHERKTESSSSSSFSSFFPLMPVPLAVTSNLSRSLLLSTVQLLPDMTGYLFHGFDGYEAQ